MDEQQKVTDNLALIEIDIETAIIRNDLDDRARASSRVLVEKAPNHPRREFLQDVDRPRRRTARSSHRKHCPGRGPAPAQAAVLPPASARAPAADASHAKRAAERSATRQHTRHGSQRRRRARARHPRRHPIARPMARPSASRRARSNPLDAPINSPPVDHHPTRDNSFPGRTVEASDSAVGRAAPPPPAARAAVPRAISRPPSNAAGSAAVPIANAPAAAPEPPAPVDVVPAKIVKRVTPMAPGEFRRKTKGYVIVRFSIGENGRVGNVEVVESTPQGVFDDAARTRCASGSTSRARKMAWPWSRSAKARLVFDAAN